jgi:hypothetical protein
MLSADRHPFLIRRTDLPLCIIIHRSRVVNNHPYYKNDVNGNNPTLQPHFQPQIFTIEITVALNRKDNDFNRIDFLHDKV